MKKKQMRRRIREMERVIAEGYQAFGVLAMEADRFGDEDVERIMDNLGRARIVHANALPFGLFTVPERAPGNGSPKVESGRDVHGRKLWQDDFELLLKSIHELRLEIRGEES